METSDVVSAVVEDIDSVRDALVALGIEVTDVQMLGPDLTPGARLLLYSDRDGSKRALQEGKRS